MRSPAGSCREARVGPGEIGVEQQPRQRDRSGCSTRCRGAGWRRLGSVVPASPTNTSSESEVELPQRERALQARRWPRCARRARSRVAHQRRTRSTGAPVFGSTRDRRAARVVAVEAAAGVDEELGLRPRPEDQRQLGRQLSVGSALPEFAGLRWLSTSKRVAVGAQAGDGAQPCRPLDRFWRRRRRCVSLTLSSRVVRGCSRATVLYRPTWMRSWRSCSADLAAASQPAERVVRTCGWPQAAHVAASACSNWSPFDRVVEAVGEVREQLRAGSASRRPSRCGRASPSRLRRHSPRQAVARGLAAVGRDRRRRSGRTAPLIHSRAAESGRSNSSFAL